MAKPKDKNFHGEGNILWKDYHTRKGKDKMLYRGIQVIKNPMDLWNYQEVIEEHDIHWVIETGTHRGGSALFLADVLKNRNAKGKVYTIDRSKGKMDSKVKNNPYLVLMLEKSSVDPERVKSIQEIFKDVKEKIFLVLDSSHTPAHVEAELKEYIPILKSGDYVVIEDTHALGPREGLANYLKAHPGSLIHDEKRNTNFGLTYAPKGYFTVK